MKKFTYRGDANEEFSNKYYLTGTDPASPAAWTTLFDALVAEEKKLFTNNVSIIRGYGYTDDSPTAASVWSRDLVAAAATVAGTFVGGGQTTPGDVAACVRWKTSRLTSKGKPIYLRKYYHGARADASVADNVLAAHKTAYEAFATLLWDGAGVDGREIRGPGQASEVILGSSCLPHLTTRTLKRRGKRPTTT